MKIRKLITLLVLLSIVMTSTNTIYASNVTLSVTSVQQSYSMWCWAACSEMSGKYYYNYKTGHTSYRTQSMVVENEYGYLTNSGGTPAQIETGCEYVAYDDSSCNASDISAAATFSNIVGFINLNKPTIAWHL